MGREGVAAAVAAGAGGAERRLVEGLGVAGDEGGLDPAHAAAGHAVQHLGEGVAVVGRGQRDRLTPVIPGGPATCRPMWSAAGRSRPLPRRGGPGSGRRGAPPCRGGFGPPRRRPGGAARPYNRSPADVGTRLQVGRSPARQGGDRDGLAEDPGGRNLLDRFRTMVAAKGVDDLTPWLREAIDTELASFASCVRDDEAVGRAAIVEPWSNGHCVFRRSRPGIPISSRPPIRREAGHRSDLKPATAAAFPQVRDEVRVGGVSGQAG